mgnify:CR=1 FL=1
MSSLFALACNTSSSYFSIGIGDNLDTITPGGASTGGQNGHGPWPNSGHTWLFSDMSHVGEWLTVTLQPAASKRMVTDIYLMIL